MASENHQSKEFEPSQKKLDEARNRGDIARSTDLTSAIALLAYLAMFFGFGHLLYEWLGTSLSIFLQEGPGQKLAGINASTKAIVLAIVPVFLLPALLILGFLIATKGITFSTERLSPKLERISIISNMRQKFGTSGLVEFLKNVVKLLAALSLVTVFITMSMHSIARTSLLQSEQGLIVIFHHFGQFFIYSAAITTVIGLADFLWQKLRHLSKLRMTRQEMKQEARESEGDQHLKQRRRQKGFDIATNRMLLDVPQAQVIIVNPDHYAVALSWDASAAGAPKCVAKGIDELSFKIREIAARHSIPIHRDPPTARALYATVQIGEDIRPDHYRAVAAAIRFSETIRRKSGHKP